jgi:hypothetical protein
MRVKYTTVATIAQDIGVPPKAFGAALRGAKFPPRKVKQDWEVKIGSEEHSAMRTVLVTLLRRGRGLPTEPKGLKRPAM